MKHMKGTKNLKKKKKDKKLKKVRDRYQNLSEEQKQKLLEYMKKYYLAHMLFGHFIDIRAIKFISWISP